MLSVKITINIILLLILSNQINAQELSINDIQEDTIFVMTKSPWEAVLRSAIIPGWGQYYNESYLKIPFIYGLGGWFIYNYIINNNSYKDYSLLYKQNYVENYRRLREFYRDQRDLFLVYTIIVYFLNIVDAYVDAHLFDFTVSEDFFRSPQLKLIIPIK